MTLIQSQLQGMGRNSKKVSSKLGSVSVDINQILRNGSEENVQLTAAVNKF
jgi:hypothetical protein